MNYFKKAIRKLGLSAIGTKLLSFADSSFLGKRKQAGNAATATSTEIFPLCPELFLPANTSEKELFQFLETVCPTDASPRSMRLYCKDDFKRFVYTWGLAKDLSGKALELGANPYFTTILLQKFTNLELELANYLGPNKGAKIHQAVNYVEHGQFKTMEFESHNFNVEEDKFPFADDQFDVVFFCEIIEHLLMDPAGVIKEIKRILKPNAFLILSTPNVSRLDNVARLMLGTNIYDPYSAHGPYGRHNREYTRHDLYLLLSYLGFEISEMFTADVHENYVDAEKIDVRPYAPLLDFRKHDLGQYIFVKAKNVGPAGQKKPTFLYQSYPESEIEWNC